MGQVKQARRRRQKGVPGVAVPSGAGQQAHRAKPQRIIFIKDGQLVHPGNGRQRRPSKD